MRERSVISDVFGATGDDAWSQGVSDNVRRISTTHNVNIGGFHTLKVGT